MLPDLFVMLVSGLMAGYFGNLLRRGRALRRDGAAATARVIGQSFHREPGVGSGDWKRYYTVTLRYTAQDGRTVTTEVVVNSPRPPGQGQDVRIRYDPRNPRDVQIDTLFGRGTCWQVPVLLVCVAIFAVALVAFVRAAT